MKTWSANSKPLTLNDQNPTVEHRSLPLLRRFLDPRHEDLHEVAFDIIPRIGPPAIPLLVDLLRHEEVSFRRFAADALIDLAPDTESIQPALRRALRDEDSMVAGDAARALGALGRASPSVAALVNTLSHEDPYVRIYAAEALASIGANAAKATNALAEALGESVREALRAAASDPTLRNEAEWRAHGISSEGWRIPLAGRGPASGARSARVSVAFDDKRALCGREPIVRCHRRVPNPLPRHTGFRDGENNGPYREEVFQDNAAADIVWELEWPRSWW